MAFAAKGLLLFVTVVCLLSMGGAMAVAAPAVVPLHVFVARRSGPHAAGGWVFLAGASLFEFTAMWTWVAVENAATAIAAGLAAGTVTIAVLLRDTAARQFA